MSKYLPIDILTYLALALSVPTIQGSTESSLRLLVSKKLEHVIQRTHARTHIHTQRQTPKTHLELWSGLFSFRCMKKEGFTNERTGREAKFVCNKF